MASLYPYYVLCMVLLINYYLSYGLCGICWGGVRRWLYMYPQHLGSSYNTYTTAIHQDRTRQGQHVHNSAAHSTLVQTISYENNALKLYSTVRAKQLQYYNTNYARNFLSQIFFSKFSRNYNNAHILRKFITGHFFTVGLAFIMILCNEKTFKA